jgi:glycolate dehydrogenase iron-sulfur subunit
VLVELGPVAPRHPLPLSVAYHDACHLAHAQGVRAQPRGLLADIPGVSLREIASG